MIGSINNKTIVFKCPECGRTMMGSTIKNRTKMIWSRKHRDYDLKPIYICDDCLERASAVKLEQRLKKQYGGK